MKTERWKEYLQTSSSIIAVVLSMIALYFSWQASKAVTHPVSTQVIVLDATWDSTVGSPINLPTTMACVHQFKLVNLGSMPTAIIGYKVKISFGESKITYEELSGTVTTPDRLTPEIGPFKVYLFPADHYTESPLDTENALTFPHRIDPHNTSEIMMATSFSYSPTLKLKFTASKDLIQSLEREGHTTMILSYIFITETGQEVISPRVYCTAIE